MAMDCRPGDLSTLLRTGLCAVGLCGMLASPVFAERVISIKDDVVISLDTPRDRGSAGSANPIFRCTARQGDDSTGEVIVTRTFTKAFEFPAGFAVRPPTPWHVSDEYASTKKFPVAFSLIGHATRKDLDVPPDGVIKTLTFGLDILDWLAFAQARTITLRAVGLDVNHERLELMLPVNGTQIDAGLRACRAKAVASAGPLF